MAAAAAAVTETTSVTEHWYRGRARCWVSASCGQVRPSSQRAVRVRPVLHCGGSPFGLGCSLNYIERSELPVFKNYVIVARPLINMVFKLLSKMLDTLKSFVKEALYKISSDKSRCFSPKIFAIVIFYFSRMNAYSFPFSLKMLPQTQCTSFTLWLVHITLKI